MSHPHDPAAGATGANTHLGHMRLDDKERALLAAFRALPLSNQAAWLAKIEAMGSTEKK